ncbi:hypothetical protein PYCC9005_004214 [Savitreella phatthalungensis]
MTTLDKHIELLESSAASLSANRCKSSRAYQNALLRRRDITALIRDAEPHEAPLFSSKDGQQQRVKLMHDPTVRQVLRDREADPELLLQACEKLLDIYPVDRDGVQAQVDLIRHKVFSCRNKISQLESEVERQRSQLDQQSSGRRGQDEQAQVAAGFASTPQKITQEMIDREENEIRQLEKALAEA